jgi:hypothetical protein
MFARFKKRHEVIDPEVGKIIYPRGWAGELEKDTYNAAKKAGVLMPSLELESAAAKSGGDAQKIAKAEKALVAAKEKLATASEAEKAAAQVAVTEAEAALAALKA